MASKDVGTMLKVCSLDLLLAYGANRTGCKINRVHSLGEAASHHATSHPLSMARGGGIYSGAWMSACSSAGCSLCGSACSMNPSACSSAGCSLGGSACSMNPSACSSAGCSLGGSAGMGASMGCSILISACSVVSAYLWVQFQFGRAFCCAWLGLHAWLGLTASSSYFCRAGKRAV
eukprot:scaffold92610_cov18-Tisochrysis_lutea.AAC.1